jgi:hypothetical protein
MGINWDELLPAAWMAATTPIITAILPNYLKVAPERKFTLIFFNKIA